MEETVELSWLDSRLEMFPGNVGDTGILAVYEGARESDNREDDIMSYLKRSTNGGGRLDRRANRDCKSY